MRSTDHERLSKDEQACHAYDPTGESGYHETNETSGQSIPVSRSDTRMEDADADAAQSDLAIQKQKTRLMSPKVQKLRKKVLYKFLQTTITLSSFLICILSIYWGAQYNESHFMHKVNVLVVIQDESGQGQSSLVENLPAMTQDVPCTWHVYNTREYQNKRNIRAAQIDEEFVHQIHHQDYWMGLNVKPNATDNLVKSLTNASAQPFNFSEYFQAVFESGRDPSTMRTAILPNMQQLEQLYEQEVVKNYLPRLVSRMNNDVVRENLIGASNVHFDYQDYRPFYSPVILSPLQVGLIYCLLLTFFQLGFYSPLHVEMAQLLKLRSLLFYRLITSLSTYFILSLFFCTLSAIFHIDFTKAFGRSGFVVYWMTTWLLMAALGGANENVASIIMVFCPQYIGLWLMCWIVLNISPAF